MCSQSISGARTRKHGDHPHICVLRWLGVPRIFLSAPLSSDAVAFYLSRGAQHLRDGKLATSYLKKDEECGGGKDPQEALTLVLTGSTARFAWCHADRSFALDAACPTCRCTQNDAQRPRAVHPAT